MVRNRASKQVQMIDGIIPVRDRNGSTLDSLSSSAEPGAEGRAVRARLVLCMVHQMGDGRRIEERGQSDQRDGETERDHAAGEAV